MDSISSHRNTLLFTSVLVPGHFTCCMLTILYFYTLLSFFISFFIFVEEEKKQCSCSWRKCVKHVSSERITHTDVHTSFSNFWLLLKLFIGIRNRIKIVVTTFQPNNSIKQPSCRADTILDIFIDLWIVQSSAVT